MKECLHCKKEFQEKKITAKYCSTSCRVMYNRNREKKVEKLQGKVVYNQILDAIDEFRGLIKSSNIQFAPTTQNSFDSHKVSKTIIDEVGQWQEPLPWDNNPIIDRKPKSVIKYVMERLQLDTPEGFEKWTEELESDPFLSDRDKKDAKIKTL